MRSFLSVVGLGLFALPCILAISLPGANDIDEAVVLAKDGLLQVTDVLTPSLGTLLEDFASLPPEGADEKVETTSAHVFESPFADTAEVVPGRTDAGQHEGVHDAPRDAGTPLLSVLARVLVAQAGNATTKVQLDAILRGIVQKTSKGDKPGGSILDDIRGGVESAWRDVASALGGVREAVEDVASGAPRVLGDVSEAMRGAFNGTEDPIERIEAAFKRIEEAFAHADAELAPCRVAPDEIEVLVRVVLELLGRPLDARGARVLRTVLRLGAGGVPGVLLGVLSVLGVLSGMEG